jgi:acetylornithine deacetylase
VTVERGDAVALARELIRIDSRNPSLSPNAPGEGAVARALGEILSGWGMTVELDEVLPGRPNVIARTGATRVRSLMLNGHLDVVGTTGMTHEPFAAEEREGRIYGRGSTDMKGGIAAMCAAAARAAEVDGEVVIAAVADEEYESAGTRALVERGVRADAAIVTEPTRMAIMPAHRGFVWIEVTVHGRAAHGSRYDLGVDAIRNAGLLLAELDALERETLVRRVHPLLGRASLHASHIEGGIGMSTYPDRCVLKLERRTMPGESVPMVMDEVRAACDRLRAAATAMRADVTLMLAQGPSDVPVEAPIVRALSSALEASGEAVRVEGMSAWTDAAILNEAGIPAICFGPGDITLAHAAEEYVEVSEIERATTVLTALIGRWLGGGEGSWRS